MLRRIGFLVGLGLFLWVLSSTDLAAVWEQIRQFQWRFGVVVLFYGGIFILDTLGWKYALNPERNAQVGLGPLFRARLAGEAVNYVTPTAYIGGEPVKAVLLSKRHGVPLAEGMASVVIAKTTFVLSMLLFILAGLGVTLATQSLQPVVSRWVWVILPVMVLLFSLFLAVQFFQPFHRGSSFLGRMTPRWLGGERLIQWFERVESRMQEWDREILDFYRRSPGSVLWSFGFHFLGWVAGGLEVFVILRFLEIPVSLATAFSIESLWILLKSAAFVIPGSLGVSEGVLVMVCGSLGVGAVSGLALGLIRRARELLWVGWGLLELNVSGGRAA